MARERRGETSVEDLSTDESKGLTSEEARARLQKYGPNEVREARESRIHWVLRRFWGPIPWMIEAAALFSLVLQRFFDLFVIVSLLLFISIIDMAQEARAMYALRALRKKLARKALVLRDGKFETIDATFLVPGDIIKLRLGDIVPADAKLVSDDYVKLDQSALTGESLPVTKTKGGIAYSNSIVKQGEARAIVLATGKYTFFRRTAELVMKAEKKEGRHFQKTIISIGNYLIAFAIVAIFIILTVSTLRGNFAGALDFSAALIIAAVPYTMPAVLSVTLAFGALDLAEKGAIVSRLVAIEELAGVDVLCCDKTGTLTKNKMELAKPENYGQFSVEELIVFAMLASREENRDPIEVPIFEYAKENGFYDEIKHFEQVSFTPFDPASKRSAAVVKRIDEAENGNKKESKYDFRSANGKFSVVKGAPQVIVAMCENVDRTNIDKAVAEYANNGFRTICVAVSASFSEEKNEFVDYQFAGIIPLLDPPWPDSRATIDEARRLGVNVKMLTGDNIAIARHISKVLGIGGNILDSKALEEELRKSELARLAEKRKDEGIAGELRRMALERIGVAQPSNAGTLLSSIEEANGFSQVFPEEKYIIVDELQKGGHIVGMTGDGVNDAPALRKADAGIAVARATEAARAASDLILTTTGISVIIDAVAGARRIFERMRTYSIYKVADTILFVLFITISVVFFDFFPVTSIMLILLALLNGAPVLGIAYDNTKVERTPELWNLRRIFTISTVLGIYSVVASFGMYSFARIYLALPLGFTQSALFVELAFTGLLILATRNAGFFWQRPFPAPFLIFLIVSTKAVAVLFAVYGIFVAPVGWFVAGLVVLYSIVWFVITDAAKVVTIKLLDLWENRQKIKHIEASEKTVAHQ